MRSLRAWLMRVTGLFGRAQRDRELAAEIESHLQLHIDDNIRSGMSPEEARRDALLKFGPVESIKESCRDRRGIPAIETSVQDVRFAVRALRSRPVYSGLAILTLGLGIGAATSMFSVVNGVLLKTLPFEEPSRLVAVWQTVPGNRNTPGDDGARWDRYRLTYMQYRDLSGESTLYDGLAAYRAGTPDVATLTGVGEPVELRAGAATASMLPVLGIEPALGRWFIPEEEASRAGDDGASVAVVSHELWRSRFGASIETLGRVVTIDDRPFEIIGVLPHDFRIEWLSALVAGEATPGKRDIWFPVGAPGWTAAEWGYSWETIGRLLPEVSIEQAQADAQRVLSAHPNTLKGSDFRVHARTAEETRGLAPPLVLLFGATAFLLLIACGNVATLSLAAVLSRRHEIATRSALGASSSRIMRLLLTESFVLAVVGSAVGVALAFAGTGVLVALAPPIPRLHEVSVDLRVLGFAALVGTFAAFLFGTAPAVLASRNAAAALRVSAAMSLGRRRFASTVVTIEVAMTVMLLVAGGLLAQSYSRLLALDPGFEAMGLATVEVRLSQTRYPTREARARFYREALDELEAVPGIGAVAAASRLPYPGYTSTTSMFIAGQQEPYSPLFYQVSPGYLEMLRVPLLAGRPLADTDGPGAPVVVLINETAARRFWPPDEHPVGAQVSLSYPREPVTVVGVVGDMRRQSLKAEAEPTFFIPFSQLPDETICFLARTQPDHRDVLSLMRGAIGSVDRDLVVKNSTTVEALVAESAEDERYRALLMCVFGILASLLAGTGAFGVAARGVALRARELGVRMALGARASRLIGTSMWSTLVAGLAGIAAGLIAALWTSRLLARFLFGIEATDPTTYGVVAASVLILCLIASYAAARSISRLSPMDVLRAE